MLEDIMRPLKFKRSKYATDRQLSFFDILCKGGIEREIVSELVWADFVGPLLAQERSKILINGKSVKISRSAWRRLSVEFRSLAASNDLRSLLTRRIALHSRSRRAA